jgi:hypothetical protein
MVQAMNHFVIPTATLELKGIVSKGIVSSRPKRRTSELSIISDRNSKFGIVSD